MSQPSVVERPDPRRRVTPNPPRYAFVLPMVVGAFVVGLGYMMGHAHFDLIQSGAHAEGKIIGRKDESWRTSSGGVTNAHMPVGEFRANGRVVRFEDWLGHRSGEDLNARVPVLYDPAHPSVAMIDRPLWNWLPWAPIAAVGILLILDGLRRGMRTTRA